MMIPTIHLNGTSKAELYRQVEVAGQAAYALLEALGDAAPNGRDYYPQGPDALARAQAEHNARCAAVHGIINDLAAMLEAIP